jgi:O-Antigen ligase.
MLLILGFGMIGCIILHSLKLKEKIFKFLSIELKLWILFAFFTFATGIIVAVNYDFLLKSIMTFCEFLMLIFGIVYISNQDRNINFFVNIMIILAIVCAITAKFWGIDYGFGRIAMGSTDNPNSLGITMAIGVCCILYKLNIKKLFYSIIGFGTIFFLIYITLLTGSRKSFIGVLLIFIFWILFVAFAEIKVLSSFEKMKVILTVVIIVGIGYYIFNPLLKDSLLFLRLNGLFQQTGMDVTIREDMYSEALKLFRKSPLIGIGLNNFRAVSLFKTYSHSTYAEALACTGIIGSILYFIPYLIIFINYVKIILNRKIEDLLLKQAKIMFGLFGLILFLGVGIIHFYEIISNIAFGMLIAFSINMKNYMESIEKKI